MKRSEIAQQRLVNQHIARARFQEPARVVEWLGAVQAQDYEGAKWSLGLRLRGAGDADIEQAFSEGAILRTHLLRPTWHFVTPADIRWMLEFTAPRVHQANASMYRKLGLDNAVFRRSNAALARALKGRQLTRDELRDALQKAGVVAEGEFRMGYLLMRAELDGLICSGARSGKQFTYALLDERVPSSSSLSRDDALAELARRYFRSRGPAGIPDFAKWSGLTMASARSGLEAVESEFEQDVVDGQSRWYAAPPRSSKKSESIAYLLSVYDEYVSGYKDHSAIARADYGAKLMALGNAVTHILVINGQIVGTWKRVLKKDSIEIATTGFRRLTKAETRAVAQGGRRYGEFHGLEVRRHTVDGGIIDGG